eukprot:TRINITY_DN15793_c0_g1_i1.p1 TRINITY_DN15793_c0_g1~~TRINITY_DN15793_c0_g1_i1.p1  ORF type:complete len:264 (-),score=72.17 TRINITY_DN15793_c0_g1_i1:25-816(-)
MCKFGWAGANAINTGSIDKMIRRFNQISCWVTSEILTKQDIKTQIQVLEKFIKLARACERLNNFNTVMEIISGLNNFVIQRLKKLWANVHPKSFKMFGELEELMDGHHNYKHYKNELLERKLPVLPYFGLFMRDMEVISQCNPAYRPDKSINLEVMRLLWQRSESVAKFQSVPFEFQESREASQFCEQMVIIEDEDELYRRSINLEPFEDIVLPPSPKNRKHIDDDAIFEVLPPKPERRKSHQFGIVRRFRSSSSPLLKHGTA